MDIITGFCNENEQDHLDTLTLMKAVKYDFGYMFKYSERPNTLAEESTMITFLTKLNQEDCVKLLIYNKNTHWSK